MHNLQDKPGQQRIILAERWFTKSCYSQMKLQTPHTYTRISAVLLSQHDTLEKTSSPDEIQIKCPVMKHNKMSITFHNTDLSMAA